ncbi:MAG TPA: NAD(P)-dependent oxidoreductase [Candidatus Saccharimonadales bacterium]|nr:NAD(P)-dependent oxidoreductase [Candidatus Saccharimonadales bacterium]
MKPTVLVTDTLFIFPEHEERLRAAGLEVERIENAHMSEDELIEALRGKSGYIIGGLETTTERVAESVGEELKVVTFTGADWAHFIPRHETLTKKGVRITNTPGNTTTAVSEFTITMLLMMLRRALQFGGPGTEAPTLTQSLPDVHVGVIGMGRIGERVARLLLRLGAGKVSYWNRHRKPELEAELGIEYLELPELMASCDVLTNHVSSQAEQLIGKDLLDSTKEGVLIINAGGTPSFNMDALYERITQHGARAAFDVEGVKDERFQKLPLAQWYCTVDNAAYKTRDCLRTASDMATESVINVLTTGDDQYVVNRT